jgi:hypothetical protein
LKLAQQIRLAYNQFHVVDDLSRKRAPILRQVRDDLHASRSYPNQ